MRRRHPAGRHAATQHHHRDGHRLRHQYPHRGQAEALQVHLDEHVHSAVGLAATDEMETLMMQANTADFICGDLNWRPTSWDAKMVWPDIDLKPLPEDNEGWKQNYDNMAAEVRAS